MDKGYHIRCICHPNCSPETMQGVYGGTSRFMQVPYLLGFLVGMALSTVMVHFFMLPLPESRSSIGTSRIGRHLQVSPFGDNPLGVENRHRREAIHKTIMASVEQELLWDSLEDPLAYLEDNGIHFDAKVLERFKPQPLLSTAVLTAGDNLVPFAEAMEATWGDKASPIKYYVMAPEDMEAYMSIKDMQTVQAEGEAYGYQHMIKTLKGVCSDATPRHQWYLVTHDGTYINIPALHKVLTRLVSTDPVIIGKPIPHQNGKCQASEGLLLSQSALGRLCPSLYRCESLKTEQGKEDTSLLLARCFKMAASLGCNSFQEINENFHISIDGKIPGSLPSQLQSKANHWTAIVNPLQTMDDFYTIHLHFMEGRIHKNQQQIFHLGKELVNSKKNLRPGQDEYMLDSLLLEDSTLMGLLNSIKANSTGEPFYQYIDKAGNMYLDSCQVQTVYVGGPGSAYRAAKDIAEAKLGLLKARDMDHFSYRIVKPDVGVEYQFFYIQEAKAKNLMMSAPEKHDKVYHVTVVQPFGQLSINSKFIQVAKEITIVTPIDRDTIDVKPFLDNIKYVCFGGNEDVRCKVIIVLFLTGDIDNISYKQIQAKLDAFKLENPHGQITIVRLKDEDNSLQRTISKVHSLLKPDSLLAHIPNHITFTKEFLYRCQLNINSHSNVYFPITFQRYSERIHVTEKHIQNHDISEDLGHWSKIDYDTFCINMKFVDLNNVPLESPEKLYNFLQSSGHVKVFRAPDPAVFRSWKNALCKGQGLEDRTACIKYQKFLNLE